MTQALVLRVVQQKKRCAHPGAGIAHDGDEAVEEHHGHGEDEEEQQDDAHDGVVAVVEQVQVGATQHDGEQRHKGMQDVAKLLQSTHTHQTMSVMQGLFLTAMQLSSTMVPAAFWLQ